MFRGAAFAVVVAAHGLAVVGPWITGVSIAAVALCAALYVVQMFAVTAGYHRYFAHRTFETGRVFRTWLAFFSLTTLQRPVTWWAAQHRDHHRFADTEHDAHSPVVHPALRSHMTWSFYADVDEPLSHANDLARFPEVAFLDRYWRVPFFLLAGACGLLLGWQGVLAAVWSTVLVYHATSSINSLAHTYGWRRYPTADRSRNNGWLALATFGEGWHNNHHHYPASCRQGFFWWELDLTWLALRLLQRLGVVWSIRDVPARVRGPAEARAPALSPEPCVNLSDP